MKKISIFWLVSISILFIPVISFAHPGRTDSSGCHTCRTNCSSWGLSYGEYHCHNNKGVTQPESPIHSVYGSGGTGYTVPAPDYEYSSSYSTIPSCPLMSTYDSLSDSCKCISGYVVDTDFLGNESCVSADSKCTDMLGYGGRYNSLSNKCECRYGYLYDGSECVSENTYCHDRLGLMSSYNSLTDKCECDYGYEYDGSSCVYKSTSPSIYSASAILSQYSCPSNSHESPDDPTKCQCDAGYELNSTKDGCVLSPVEEIKPSVPGCTSEKGYSVTSGLSCDGENRCSGGMQLSRENTCIPIPEVSESVKNIESAVTSTKSEESSVISNNTKEENVEKVEKEEEKKEPMQETTSQPVKELKWYQKIFNWFL